MALFTIVTTCKGRLAHLRQSLPTFAALADAEVVLVDYDCPERCGDWAEANVPSVKVVRVLDRPLFNAAEARNLGAAAAGADWLFFADADVGLTPAVGEVLALLRHPGSFALAEPRPAHLGGVLFVSKADFEAQGGYDVVYEGYGSEDVDMSERLGLAGLALRAVPSALLAPIEHEDVLRSRFHAQAHQPNQAVNGVYFAIKRTLMKQGVDLNLDVRRSLYAEVKRMRGPEDMGGVLDIAFQKEAVFGVVLTSAFRFSVGPPEG